MYTDDPDIETCDFRLTTIYNTTNITTNETSTNATSNATSNATKAGNTTSANKTAILPAKGNFTKVAW